MMMEEIQDLYTLSPLQQGMLFHSVYAKNSGMYMTQMAVTIKGRLERAAFTRAWQQVVDRHSIFRTGFIWGETEQPLQVVYQQVPIQIAYHDWSQLGEKEQQNRLQQEMEQERQTDFVLEEAPLMRWTLCKTAEQKHEFIWTYHHVLLDGWSLPIVLQEVFSLYDAMCRGEQLSLPTPRPYHDYIKWLRTRDDEADKAFWQQFLSGFTAPTPISVVEKREASQEDTPSYQTQFHHCSPSLTQSIERLAKHQQLTLNTWVQAAWSLLLSLYSGEKDIVYGTTVSGRPADLEGVEQMVGLFINTIPMRVQMDEQQTVATWLQQIQQTAAELKQVEHTPLIDIQHWSELPPGAPLFHSLFVFENYPVQAGETTGGFRLQFGNVRAIEQTNYPLTLVAAPGERLQLKIIFDQQRYEESVIQRLLTQLEHLLQQLVERMEQPLAQLDLLPSEEKRQLQDWHEQPSKNSSWVTIPEQIGRQAQQTPDQVAVMDGERTLTYRQIEEEANQIARYLRSLGIQEEDRVGLCLSRRAEMVSVLLGIWKAGAAYVPLDPNYPVERIQWMLEDAQVSALMTEESLLPMFSDLSLPKLTLEERPWQSINNREMPSYHQPSSLAYLIYTSGSTGKPKGVMIEHRNVCALLHWAKQVYQAEELAGVLAATSLCFDLSVFELFVPLTTGGSVMLVRDALSLKDFPLRNQVTLINTVPSAAAELVRQQAIPASVQTINLAGEPLTRSLVEKLYAIPTVKRVYNLYGPSEDTTYSTFERVERETQQAPTIGFPIAGTQAYVLDQQGRRLPIGVIGELHLAGDGVARGYYRRAALTAERFIMHPQYGRLYRTGDLVHVDERGRLHFHGRRDFQVKVRGYRIELGEIEAALAQHPAVEETVVIAEQQEGDVRLLAYLVATAEDDWRQYLQGKLPAYMIPNHFISLSALPLTPNGKIDRQALPKLEQKISRTSEQRTEQTPVAQIVMQICQDVLQQEDLTTDDHFFVRGGHSLLATQVVTRLEQALELELPLRLIFEHPTIGGLVQAVEDFLQRGKRRALPPLQRYDREGDVFPLSYAQQRVWFFEQMTPGQTTYHLPFAMRIKGECDLQKMQQAVDRMVEKHEILRTTFHEQNGEAVQRIHPHMKISVQEILLTGTEREQALTQAVQQELQSTFSLSEGPLMRVFLYRLHEKEAVLLVHMHHIISDGWSMAVWLREWLADEMNDELPVQYRDYAQWQREWLQDEIYEQQLTYWKQQLADAPILELPTDWTRPSEQTFTGETYTVILPTELSQQLRRLSQEEDATLFMTLLAGYQLLLSRYSGQKDIAVGSPIANRQQEKLEQLIGFFVNTLTLRTQVNEKLTFREWLAQVRKTCLDAYAHQDIPFERIVDELQPERNLRYTPLFQTMFVLQNLPLTIQKTGQMQLEPYELKHQVAKFDLTLTMMEDGERLVSNWEYNVDLFSRQTIERLAQHFIQLLTALMADPDKAIGQVTFLSEAEEQQLLTWRGERKRKTYPSLIEVFSTQVQRSPTKAALQQEKKSLSYQELDHQSTQLAHWLQQTGVQKGDIVAIYLPRSFDLIVAMIAILKAGAAYLPLDIEDPPKRSATILHNARSRLVISTGQQIKQLPGEFAYCLLDQIDWSNKTVSIAIDSSADDLAYVMYTSGSTGKPKGVEIEQRGILRLVLDGDYAQFGADEVFLQLAPTAFDASTFEIWGSLLHGATLVLMPPETPSLAEIAKAIETYNITTMWLTAGLFHLMVDHQLSSLGQLKQLLVGGDVISPTHVKKVLALQSVQVINGYGPTENTTFTCCYPVPADWSADAPLPIGRPIAQTQVYILDEQQQLVPCGVAGELYIGGDGLARGYLQQPELTAERFIDHPRWGRLYRTGDRVRFLPDRNLHFLGRIDQQVKIRGFRIELSEVEEALRQHPQVHETVVIVREKRLLAYLVYDSEQEMDDAELRAYLREHLPEYMIPAAFLPIDAIPLTRNGKVDRSALPEPDFTQLALAGTHEGPRNWREEKLQQIWKEVLQVERIGIHDNFFQLGGDSILSIQVVAKAKQQGLQLTPKQIFSHQTIAKLATVCQQSESVTMVEEEVQGEVPLTPIQQWFFEQPLVDRHHFNQAILMQIDRTVAYGEVKQALQRLMEEHDVFRLRFTWSETWQQIYSESEERPPVEWLDLSELSTDKQRETMQRIAERTQTQLDLQHGPLFRAVYFYLGDQVKAHRLLLVAHHLVVDGVSWRILLHDLEQLLQGKKLPPKTTSYQKWAQLLRVEAQSPSVVQERIYWQQVVKQSVRRLPKDHPQGLNTEALAETWVTQLSVEETEQLLREAPQAYRAQMLELLLAAFGRTMVTWLDESRCLFHMEGHGREEIATGVDLSRTVGWFTSLYPVVLSFQSDADPADDVHKIKQQWRQIPRHGLGYGLLHYLSDQPFTNMSPVEVSFNYLGQFGAEEETGRLVKPVQEPIGSTVSPRAERPYVLEVTAVISKGRLGITWRYSRDMYREKTIRRLSEQLMERLRTLLAAIPKMKALPSYHDDDFPLTTVAPDQLLAAVKEPQQIEDLYPVTPLQHGMLFHTVHQRSRQDYVTQLAMTLQGICDRDRFQAAWQQLVDRHTILRTAFLFPSEGEPHQVVYRQVEVRVKFLDWRALPSEQWERKWQTLLDREREKGFALNKPPLMRLLLIQLADETYRFVWTHHHVLLDGWSIPILLQELFTLYRGQACVKTTPFSTYVAWLQQQDHQAALAFWKRELNAFTETTQIPDTQLAPEKPSTPQEVQMLLSERLSQQLDAFAKQHRLTLNTVLQGAWAILLSYLSGQRDLLYGVTSSGRPAEVEGIERMVGLLINTLPTRVQVSAEESLISWLQSLQQSQVQRQQYAYLPLVEVQECSAIPMGTPLFETLFVFENYPVDSLGEREANGELRIDDVSTFDQSHFPFTFIAGSGHQVSLKIAFDGQRYSAETIKRYLQYYQHLLSDMIARPNAQLGDLSLVSAEEKRQYIQIGQGKKTDFPRNKTLVEIFRSQVERAPQAIALVEQKRQWTYLQVEQASNQLARYLIAQGIKKGQRIALAMDRSAELVTAILAILKVGAAYVPLDPAYPREMWQQMVTEAQPVLLITDHKYKQRFVGFALRKLILDDEQKSIAQMADAAPAVQCDSDALAYVMYTSGSTGRPKGVAIRHRSILRLVKEADYARLSSDETFLLLAPISFDASTFELWGSLLNGARLVILREEKPSLTQMANTIIEQRVTTLWLTAGLFSLMVDHHLQALSGLRQLLVGGDVVSVSHVQKVLAALPHVQLINGYGPTESTTFAACFPVPASWQGRTLPIGRPIAHTELYVLDNRGKPLPPDVVGECYIGGEGLAQGYWQREDLTQKAFVPHPFSDDPSARLYRTGDLVRYTSDGEWIFIGRRDQQVKVRGYRVELDAIYAVVQQYEGVQESIISYEREKKQLLAYVVGDVQPQEIQRFLARKLPPYMVPSQVIVLKELPLTANGKIDRQALPRPQEAEKPTLARTPVEKRLISIWETILQRSPIGVHDHFFHLGGHSFHALQMMAVIEKEWSIQLPLATLFTHPTIAQLAERLQQEQEIQSSPLVVCLKQGLRERIPPLFLIHPQGGGVLSFATLANLLEAERPIYALQSVGYEGEEMPLSTIEAMAEVYLREIRQIQPQGPYYLLGWSMGGCIAHELACRLEAQGGEVAWVAMLDSTWLSEEKREPFIRRITAPEAIEAQAAALQVASDAPQIVVWVNNGLAYAQYRPRKPLSADLYLFRAKDEQQPIGSYQWKPFTKGKYEEIFVSGDHQSLLQEPYVQKLAAHLRRLLPKPMKV